MGSYGGRVCKVYISISGDCGRAGEIRSFLRGAFLMGLHIITPHYADITKEHYADNNNDGDKPNIDRFPLIPSSVSSSFLPLVLLSILVHYNKPVHTVFRTLTVTHMTLRTKILTWMKQYPCLSHLRKISHLRKV